MSVLIEQYHFIVYNTKFIVSNARSYPLSLYSLKVNKNFEWKKQMKMNGKIIVDCEYFC